MFELFMAEIKKSKLDPPSLKASFSTKMMINDNLFFPLLLFLSKN
jgi:hypothetical protein